MEGDNFKNCKITIKQFSIKIDDDKCFKCGKIFSSEIKKTTHHSIPKRFKPKFNVLIPVCYGCHNSINLEEIIYKNAYNCVRAKIIKEDELIKKISNK